jgi:hypothetical protein
MKTFCCRFVLDDETYTSVRISSEELDEQGAMSWAIKQVAKIPGCIGVDDVYEFGKLTISSLDARTGKTWKFERMVRRKEILKCITR